MISESVNYEVAWVDCPPGCGNNGVTVGRGLYSPESQVCAAGIMDGSIPRSGGVMGVIRLAGQSSFDSANRSYGMQVVQGNASKWSFSTIKMNNPDFSKSDLRILDDKGEPSFEGRVEFRVDGKWGTVSNEGTSDSFARQVCRALLYKDGDKKNDKK